MRLLVDEHAAALGRRLGASRSGIFAYTNHTLMPEALETLAGRADGAACCRATWRSSTRSTAASSTRCRRASGDDADRCAAVSLIDENGERRVRMAHLAIVGSHKVNGVSRAAHRADEADDLRRLRTAVPGPVQQQDQRHHAAALAARRPTRRCPTLIDSRDRRRLDRRDLDAAAKR